MGRRYARMLKMPSPGFSPMSLQTGNPYGVAGGVFDVLTATNGIMGSVSSGMQKTQETFFFM